MISANNLNLFLEAFFECVNSKTNSIFQIYTLDYLVGPGLPNNHDFHVQEGDYVLVSKYLAKQPKNSYEYVETISTSINSGNDDRLDYFEIDPEKSLGSPLELHDYQKELQLKLLHARNTDDAMDDSPTNKTNKLYVPLSSSEASDIISIYNIAMRKHLEKNNGNSNSNKNNDKRMWVLCDDGGKDGVAYTSSFAHIEGGHVTINSYVIKSKSCSYNMDRTPCLDGILPVRMFNDCKKQEYKSTYLLYGSDDRDDYNQVKVKFEWEEESNVLTTPPIHASATLLIRVNDEDEEYVGGGGGGGDISGDGLIHLTDDLNDIQRLLNALDDEVIMWPVSSSDVTAVELLQNLINDSTNSNKLFQQKNASATSDFVEAHRGNNFSMLRRQNVDFTDQVWDVLKGCTSYTELTTCFQCIFKELCNKKLQPMLSNTNKCVLADLIRQSYNADIRKQSASWMKEEKPIVMLAEMGVEKLKRDLLSVFMKSSLVNPTQLAWYLGNVESDGLDEKFEKIKRLAHVLKMNLLLDKKSLLPRNALVDVVSKSLRYYEINDDLKIPFQIQISTLSIYEKIKKISPTTWRCDIYSNTNLKQEMYGCVLFAKKQPFNHMKMDELTDSDSKDNKQSYYMAVVQQSFNTYYKLLWAY